jgi:hypothetical protein
MGVKLRQDGREDGGNDLLLSWGLAVRGFNGAAGPFLARVAALVGVSGIALACAAQKL